MSTLKAYNLDSGDTTNLVIKTNGTTALTVNGSTQAITTAGAFTSGSTVADSVGTIRPLVSDTAKNSTSGTTVEFTGIPSWAKRVTVMFSGVSTSGTSAVQVQLGTSSGFETSGYSGTNAFLYTGAAYTQLSSGFLMAFATNDSAAMSRHGSLRIENLSGNTWVAQGSISASNIQYSAFVSGSKSLAAALTQLRITTVNGTDTFDAGSINIMYE